MVHHVPVFAIFIKNIVKFITYDLFTSDTVFEKSVRNHTISLNNGKYQRSLSASSSTILPKYQLMPILATTFAVPKILSINADHSKDSLNASTTPSTPAQNCNPHLHRIQLYQTIRKTRSSGINLKHWFPRFETRIIRPILSGHSGNSTPAYDIYQLPTRRCN